MIILDVDISKVCGLCYSDSSHLELDDLLSESSMYRPKVIIPQHVVFKLLKGCDVSNYNSVMRIITVENVTMSCEF